MEKEEEEALLADIKGGRENLLIESLPTALNHWLLPGI